ncbi:YbaY family lipoprotein [Gallaecimonas pentaromativorans]|uniref:Type III secretion system (T3SS) chaperone YscW n=1 Tax=Gallaecimonas pentaromativorans TaxID=584787 RepID=A0A3N1PC27_9GAMM|nr:YbaY family lipoprotein [Gallaecimonas pentaromativorans]ROQ24390.1 type III secretion system (T3SS) chaperone YscW [Gallaecimonas pentaromativorans]
MKTWLLSLLLLLAACQPDNGPWLHGQLHLPMDAKIPADAALVVSLDTFESPDAPIHTIVKARLDTRTWPHPYRLALPKGLGEDHTQYVVKAQITNKDGQLLYVTQVRSSVDLRRLDEPVDVLLVPVAGQREAQGL